MRAPSGFLQYMLEACVAQILPEKLHHNVEKLLRAPPPESFSLAVQVNIVALTFSQEPIKKLSRDLD